MRATRPFLVALLACLLLAAVPARAEMIGTTELLQRERIDAFLAREDVQRQFEALGVSPADAANRVASLTGAELRVLSSQVDSLPAGAGSIGTLELLLIIIIIILLI